MEHLVTLTNLLHYALKHTIKKKTIKNYIWSVIKEPVFFVSFQYPRLKHSHTLNLYMFFSLIILKYLTFETNKIKNKFTFEFI